MTHHRIWGHGNKSGKFQCVLWIMTKGHHIHDSPFTQLRRLRSSQGWIPLCGQWVTSVSCKYKLLSMEPYTWSIIIQIITINSVAMNKTQEMALEAQMKHFENIKHLQSQIQILEPKEWLNTQTLTCQFPLVAWVQCEPWKDTLCLTSFLW